jgi:hypothetical protein
MSGWIKMGVGLRRHPKVVRIASALKADRLRVIGALHAVWCVFDEHSHDGELAGYTLAVMDEEIGWRGFSAAMATTGWLVEGEDSLTVPDYEEHNGSTAKRRALDAQSKGKRRKVSAESPPDVRIDGGNVSASDADKMRNRKEKIREEKKEETKTARKRAAPAVLVSVPEMVADGVDEQHATDWLVARKGKDLAPLTPTIWQQTKAEAEKAGMSIGQAIAKAAGNGWGGFKASWLDREHLGRPGAQPQGDVFAGAL